MAHVYADHQIKAEAEVGATAPQASGADAIASEQKDGDDDPDATKIVVSAELPDAPPIKEQGDGDETKAAGESQNCNMEVNEERKSQHDSVDVSESKSGDNEASISDPSVSALRRSERNIKNGFGSYNAFNRRSFKYDDDFEYDTKLTAKKRPIEMDPPPGPSQTKRRRNNQNGVPVSFSEGGLKRTMSAKQPSYNPIVQTTESDSVQYNQGRWTSLEHFKFLEALKKFGKEWQKVQAHVSTRTSTQARSHAQKFFIKLEKKSLTLEEFLKDLDLKEVEKTLLASGMDNTDYDEEREVNMVANKKLRGSVMNIALPSNSEEKKPVSELGKRSRSEMENSPKVPPQHSNKVTRECIRKAFEQHENNDGNSGRPNKRIKISETSEKPVKARSEGEEIPCSESTNAVGDFKTRLDDLEVHPFRKLSISDFEPIQPKNGKLPKKQNSKDQISIYGTPQPRRGESMLKCGVFTSFKELEFKDNACMDDYHITPDQLFRKPKDVEVNTGSSHQAHLQARARPIKGERLSFDFCELNADQLLESTPQSYRVEYVTNSISHKKVRRA